MFKIIFSKLCCELILNIFKICCAPTESVKSSAKCNALSQSGHVMCTRTHAAYLSSYQSEVSCICVHSLGGETWERTGLFLCSVGGYNKMSSWQLYCSFRISH